jgi:hypothetical protein
VFHSLRDSPVASSDTPPVSTAAVAFPPLTPSCDGTGDQNDCSGEEQDEDWVALLPTARKREMGVQPPVRAVLLALLLVLTVSLSI